MREKIKILMVEDNLSDAELLVNELRRANIKFDIERVETEADYLRKLQSGPDLILSDYSLPQFSGLRALELLNAQKLEIPFILVSGTVGEEIVVAAMQHGATDYLLKDRSTRLGPAIRRALKDREERTERKQLEAQLIEAQKTEILGQLAGGVAHDFNNILGVIIGYSDMILGQTGSDSPVRKCADEIRHATERAAALTRQLLIFSRKQATQLVVLDLNEEVNGMDKMLRRLIDENIELTFAARTQNARISADSGQVGQVLMNLVLNARDAMPNGGKITVETQNVILDDNYALTHPGAKPGDYVMLAVSDTGTGMTDEVKTRLFEAFFTTKPKGKGTGLGLATCRTIVKQFSGHIDVHSEVGKGATFKVYFPRVEKPVDISTQFLKRGPLPRGTETLLLVEDDPSVRHLACSVLEAQGYNVLRANNGQEGLLAARECKGQMIQLVVTDVIMPQMSGKVMAEWLKATYPDLKVLFTSGYTDDAIAKHGVLEPGVAFLPKPYTPAILARKVRELLDEKTAGAEGELAPVNGNGHALVTA